ncbi:MAG: 4Fe-4S binding protein [Oscillospiraceae bacterium]|nr:4Fe-4S binding protein [Oscillospiraceae bacterium]
MAKKESAQSIRKFLPGTDCAGRGGCGFPSCAECAAAIAGGAAVNLCPACNDAAIAEIAKLTGRPLESAKHQKAFVKCAGCAAGHGQFSEMESCEAAVKSGFEAGACTYGCVGVGSCVAACTFGAMKLVEGKIVIDDAKCNGCGACEGVCPQNLIHMVPDDASNFIPCSNHDKEEVVLPMCGYGCIGCGDCADACPRGAITVTDDCASIDYEKCVGCDACTVVCQKKIIVDTYHDLTKLKGTVAFVQCRGGAENNKAYVYSGAVSCKEAAANQPDGICHYGCAGFGDCTLVCRYGALEMVDGTAKVDPDKCVGCGDCVRACPMNLPVIVPYKGAKLVPCASSDAPEVRKMLCQVGCIGCGDCVSNCPDGLIHLENGRAVIKAESCEDCQICSYVCPNNIISGRVIPEYNYLQVRSMAAANKGGAEQ